MGRRCLGGSWGRVGRGRDGSTATTKRRLRRAPGGSARGGVAAERVRVAASGDGSAVLLLALLNRLPNRTQPQ